MRTANANSTGMIRTATRLGIAAALLVAWLAIASSTAGAAYKHNVIEKTFETSCALEDPEGTIDDIAVHEASESIYVFCANIGEFGQQGMILKYNFNGQPVEYGSNVPYVNGNAIIANPASPTGNLGRGFPGAKLSVDNSGGRATATSTSYPAAAATSTSSNPTGNTRPRRCSPTAPATPMTSTSVPTGSSTSPTAATAPASRNTPQR